MSSVSSLCQVGVKNVSSVCRLCQVRVEYIKRVLSVSLNVKFV